MLRLSPPALGSAALALALCLTASAASAHSLLVNPPPLTPDDNAKSGPCGCYFGGGPEDPNDDGSPSPCPGNFPKTDLVAGEQITVSWKETVNHDGAFRLAISTQPVDGVVKADLNAGVVYDQPDKNSTSGATISAKITVPLTPCESCTLQLRQTMNGAAKPYYWSCASIRILPARGTTSSSSVTSGGAGGAGGGSGAGGDLTGSGGDPVSGSATLSAGAGTAVPPPPFHTGACAFEAASAGARSFGAGALLGALALLGGRRRRARA